MEEEKSISEKQIEVTSSYEKEFGLLQQKFHESRMVVQYLSNKLVFVHRSLILEKKNVQDLRSESSICLESIKKEYQDAMTKISTAFVHNDEVHRGRYKFIDDENKILVGKNMKSQRLIEDLRQSHKDLKTEKTIKGF